MTRPWAKIHAPMLSHRKFLRLSRAQRGDWLTLFLTAVNSASDNDLGTHDDVKSILRLFGNARPADTISQMLNLRLLDERIEDGHLLLHDWDHHQPDDPTGAKRKAAERARSKPSPVTRPSADSHATVTGQSRDSHVTVNGPIARTRSRDGDGDGDRDGDSLPNPSQREGRKGRRTKPANGRSYDDLLKRDPVEPDVDADADMSFVKP